MRAPLRSALVGCLTLAATLTTLSGQAGQQSSQAVVMKGRAPVSTDVLEVNLPRPARTELPNGLDVMVIEDHRLPQVSFQIVIPGAGGFYDPADRVGLASIATALMREGTATRTSDEISAALETMAASVSIGAGASSEAATMSGSSLTDSFAETFALAADILLLPNFPQAEVDRYRERTRAQLVQLRTNPNFLADEMFNRVVYGSHPGGRTNMTPETLEAVTHDMLVEFHRTRIVPDHAVVAFAGDITMAQARELVVRHLASWRKADTPQPGITEPGAAGPARVHFIARPNSVQSNLIVGTQAISRTSDEYDVLDVMNAVIGGGPTGRLFTILREEKGYTYGAYSGLSTPKYRGDWQAYTDVRSQVTSDALRDLLHEVARLRDEPVPEKEFEDKKRSLVAAFALSLESPARVLSYAMTQWTYGLSDDYWDEYPQRIAAITREQVQAAAKQYLDPSRLQIIVVGDPSAGGILEPFGTVVTYDTNGQRIGGGG